MTNSPLVSVVIPCYNAEKYLQVALESIINQTYPNLEIIVIDDGSQDNSYSVCNQTASEDKRILLLKNDENLGLISTLNKGISIASGKYLARMDADDISVLTRIEKQVEYLENNPDCSIVGTNSTPIDINGKHLRKDNFLFFKHSNTLSFSSYFSQPFFHGSILAKTEVLQSNHYSHDFKHSEDFELWLRLVSKGHRLKNHPDSLYYYRINPDGVSVNNENQQIESHNSASKKYLDSLLGIPVNKKVVGFLNNRPQRVSVAEIKESIQLYFSLGQKLNLKMNMEGKKYFYNHLFIVYLQCFKSVKQNSIRLFLSIQIIKVIFKVDNMNYFISKILNYKR